MKKVRTRFAPSPTGYMHIGNLRTALYAYLVAKKDNGDFILRIEDTDQNRLVEGSVDIIYDTLNRVGLHYDEGPDRPGDFGPYVQSERLPMYKEYADELVDKGGAHICFCDESVIQTQRDVAEKAGVPFKFQDPCHHLNKEDVNARMASEAFVIRQTILPGAATVYHDEVYGVIEVDREILDEQVLLKSDGFPTYKRNGDASFQDLQAKGYLPAAILNYIALLGWSPDTNQEIYTLDELTQAFSISRISKSPAIFDIEKLTWMNGMYLRAMSLEEFHELCLPYYKEAIVRKCDLKEVSKILQQRLSILSEIPEMVNFIDTLGDYDVSMFYHPKMKTNREISILALEESLKVYESIENWDSVDEVHQKLSETPARLGVKNGQFYWPIRTAVTGKQFTPGGALEIPYILGKEETIRRTRIGLEKLV